MAWWLRGEPLRKRLKSRAMWRSDSLKHVQSGESSRPCALWVIVDRQASGSHEICRRELTWMNISTAEGSDRCRSVHPRNDRPEAIKSLGFISNGLRPKDTHGDH